MHRGWMGDWVWARWYARCRRLDVQLLWPSCLAQAPNLNMARAAFAIHAFADPAWTALGTQELVRSVAALPNLPWARQAGVDGAGKQAKPVADESDEG